MDYEVNVEDNTFITRINAKIAAIISTYVMNQVSCPFANRSGQHLTTCPLHIEMH